MTRADGTDRSTLLGLVTIVDLTGFLARPACGPLVDSVSGDTGGAVTVIVATPAAWLADLPVADPLAATPVARESTSTPGRSPVTVDPLRERGRALEGVRTVEDRPGGAAAA